MEFVELQADLASYFNQLAEENRISHAYLFEGKAGSGMKEGAIYFIQCLSCPNFETAKAPCHQCATCQQVASFQAPNLAYYEPDGLSFSVDQVRDLKQDLTYKSMDEGKRRIFLIDGADRMTRAAANSLLKFIEEPDGDLLFILLTNQKEAVISTIQSRCQIVHFRTLPKKLVVKAYQELGMTQIESEILSVVARDETEALALKELDELPSYFQEIEKWFLSLAQKSPMAFITVAANIVPYFKEYTNKQATPKSKKKSDLVQDETSQVSFSLQKRQVARLGLDYLQSLYHDLLQLLTGQSSRPILYESKRQQFEKVAKTLNQKEIIQAITAINEAIKMTEANVNPQAVFEYCALSIIKTK